MGKGLNSGWWNFQRILSSGPDFGFVWKRGILPRPNSMFGRELDDYTVFFGGILCSTLWQTLICAHIYIIIYIHCRDVYYNIQSQGDWWISINYPSHQSMISQSSESILNMQWTSIAARWCPPLSIEIYLPYVQQLTCLTIMNYKEPRRNCSVAQKSRYTQRYSRQIARNIFPSPSYAASIGYQELESGSLKCWISPGTVN
jgi:hypothetical protein